MIGAIVRAERKRRGWTQQELADRSGLAQGYLTLLETGQRQNPEIDTLRKLAAAFNWPVDRLLTEAPPAVGAAPVERLAALGWPAGELAHLAAAWPEFSEAQRLHVVQTAEELEQDQETLRQEQHQVEMRRAAKLEAMRLLLRKRRTPPLVKAPGHPTHTERVPG